MNHTLAIAGLGAAARRIHLPACAKLANLRVVGGCDPVAPPGEFHFPRFPSVEEMLDRTRPDILAVVTPPDSHYSLLRTGLEAGCHVLCEKPFVSTLEEAGEICRMAEKVGRRVVVNNQYRFMNIHQQARQAIGTPQFGQLLFVSAHQTVLASSDQESGWRGEGVQRTCREFGTHVLDLCRFFFDDDPISVIARMPKPADPGGPDHLNLIQLEFPGDRVAHITLDRLSRGPERYLTMRLDGSTGCVETRLGGSVELAAGIRGGSRRPYVHLDVTPGGSAHLFHAGRSRKIASDPLNIFASATARLLAAFLDALDRDCVPPCSAQDNRRTLALMLGAYESDAKRTAVSLQY
jgi:D-apiose dehydrogenase